MNEIFHRVSIRKYQDYSKTDWPWSMFDSEAKQKRHECVFPKEMKKSYEMGKALA